MIRDADEQAGGACDYDAVLSHTVELLEYIETEYNPAILVTAMGPESMVMLDIVAGRGLAIEVVTVDTGRLPKETYALIQSVISRYGPILRVLSPDPADLEPWVRQHGPDAFYQTIELRKQCCNLRKVRPLDRCLKGKKSWITGLRRSQSVVRAQVEEQIWDEQRRLYKFNPMAAWTSAQVWSYIHRYSVPYNKLLDAGYKSVGCAPCSRAVRPGEDERAGRWWWELGSVKECGLHFDPQSGRLQRKAKP